VYKEAAAYFGQELWSVILYERSSEQWLEQLRAKVRHINAAIHVNHTEDGQSYDLCVLTALHEPELDAILQLNWGWSALPQSFDPTLYYVGKYSTFEGATKTVIAARAPTMGMPAAAILAAKMAMRFKPRCLVMTGICAGDRKEVQLGDVIVANPSWDYGNGKHSVENGEKRFSPAPLQVAVSTRIRSVVERLQGEQSKLEAVRASFQGQTPKTALSLYIGPLASGAAVLADADKFEEVKQHQRKLLGVDMEAYAVMAAASEMPFPQPEVLVLKGVSDFANAAKDDRFRHYAAYTSSRVLSLLAEQYGL
jgi:nucleoside phosphorylase